MHAANHFDQSASSKIDTRITPPDGKLNSIHCDFPAVLALIFMKLRRIVCSMNMHDMAEFQRDLNNPTLDIHNFTEIVRSNEMGIKNILQSEPMKSKPNPHHAADSLPSDWLIGQQAGGMDEWMDGWMDGWMEIRNGGFMEGRQEGTKEGRKEGRLDGWMDGKKE